MPVAPLDLDRKLQRQFRLLGAKGPVAMALAGLDMAAWDALARAQGVPLVRLLGSAPRPIPAYNSNGLGLIGPERAAVEALKLAAPGFQAIKVRLGYADAQADAAVVRAVRGAVGGGVTLMSDYNQGLSVAEAVHRLDVLADSGLAWIEEPTRRRRPRRPRADPQPHAAAHPDGRELVGAARHGPLLGARRLRPGHARRHEDRRRDRLDARRGHRRRGRAADLEPPVPRGQRAPAGGLADAATGWSTWTGPSRCCASR